MGGWLYARRGTCAWTWLLVIFSDCKNLLQNFLSKTVFHQSCLCLLHPSFCFCIFSSAQWSSFLHILNWYVFVLSLSLQDTFLLVHGIRSSFPPRGCAVSLSFRELALQSSYFGISLYFVSCDEKPQDVDLVTYRWTVSWCHLCNCCVLNVVICERIPETGLEKAFHFLVFSHNQTKDMLSIPLMLS